MGPDPTGEIDEGSDDEKRAAARAWASFNAQGGFVKIVIGAVTAALTATLTALLIALPGAVSGWVDQSDDTNSAIDVSQTTTRPTADAAAPTTAAPTASSSVPTTQSSAPTTTTQPARETVKIDSLRIRLDDSFYYLDITTAPPSEPAIVNHIGIAIAQMGLPCTSGGPPVVELLGDSAVVQETDGELTTLRFEQIEPGTAGVTPIEGQYDSCPFPYQRVSFSPQTAIEAEKPAELVVKIPRQIVPAEGLDGRENDDEWSFFAFLDTNGYPTNLDREVQVAVATTAGECGWYVADLSDIGLRQVEPPRFDPLSVGLCPD